MAAFTFGSKSMVHSANTGHATTNELEVDIDQPIIADQSGCEKEHHVARQPAGMKMMESFGAKMLMTSELKCEMPTAVCKKAP